MELKKYFDSISNLTIGTNINNCILKSIFVSKRNFENELDFSGAKIYTE